MIGYHYTSFDNWQKIKTEGLSPYVFYKPETADIIPEGKFFGVWIWRRRFRGMSHVGSIMYQVSTKKTPKIVLLKVRYRKEDRMANPYGEGIVSISHTGTFGEFAFHTGVEKSYVIVKPIPPEQIKLLEVYDVDKAFAKRRKRK